MNERTKKALKLGLKLLLSVGAVFIILRKVDFSKTLYYFGEANIWLLVLAFLAFFVSKLVSSFRLNEYFKTLKTYDASLIYAFNMTEHHVKIGMCGVLGS